MPDSDKSEYLDEPDQIFIGAVGPIPIIDPDDPRVDEERAHHRAAASAADAMHTPEELQRGLQHFDSEVRWRVVTRLIARGRDHPRTLPSLLAVLRTDPSPHVRSSIAGNLYWFDYADVIAALRQAARDEDEEVRDAALDNLAYFGDDEYEYDV